MQQGEETNYGNKEEVDGTRDRNDLSCKEDFSLVSVKKNQIQFAVQKSTLP